MAGQTEIGIESTKVAVFPVKSGISRRRRVRRRLLPPPLEVSPRQGPDANSSGLDHNQIAQELVRVGGNDFGYYVSLRRVREAIQFQQDHATSAQPLANNQLPEIA